MKLLYLANIRVPSEKGETLQVMKMCSAFAGCDSHMFVELVVPHRRNPKLRYVDPFVYFNVAKKFTIRRLPTFDLMPLKPILGKLAFKFNYWNFARLASAYALVQDADVIYSREWRTLHFLRNKEKNLIFELHDFREQDVWGYKAIEESCSLFVVITHGLKKKLVESGISEEKILVAPDAVDIEEFAVSETREAARERLGLPKDMKLVVYTGHLFEWKGIYALIDAFDILQDGKEDIKLVLVGGLEEDIQAVKDYLFEKNIRSVLVVGHRPYQDVPLYLRAADVLVMSDSMRFDISREYTSPLKLFQYMAAQKPIVAPATPALCEILNDECAWLYEPDNPLLLAQAISQAFEHPKKSKQKSTTAFEQVHEYTWKKRAEKILDNLKF